MDKEQILEKLAAAVVDGEEEEAKILARAAVNSQSRKAFQRGWKSWADNLIPERSICRSCSWRRQASMQPWPF